jgi:hypothetical protein
MEHLTQHVQTFCTRHRFSVAAWHCVLVAMVTSYPLPIPAFANQWPSLLRGVVVADSEMGVRVVRVEESSQAFLSDLRPEDIIVRVHEYEVRSIDEFATLSKALKGRAAETTVVVFRHGVPRELRLHLYSFPVLRTWGIEFIPDHDVRFAQPQIGLDHWRRMGRGFEEAQNDREALKAYLNALHNVPTDVPTALKAAELYSRVGQAHLRSRRLAEGIASLRQGVAMMERLFAHPLSDEQLRTIKRQLEETLAALRAVTGSKLVDPCDDPLRLTVLS